MRNGPFASQLAIEVFNGTVLLGLSRCYVMPVNTRILNLVRMPIPVNTLPLSETILLGESRSAIAPFNSHVTCWLERDVSATKATFSRV